MRGKYCSDFHFKMCNLTVTHNSLNTRDQKFLLHKVSVTQKYCDIFSQCNYTCSVGSKPTFWQADPSRAFWWGKPSWAFFRKRKSNQAKLFAFKTEPNWAFRFKELSNFWLFSVDFFKEYYFLVEKNKLLLMSSGLYLKEVAKMWKSTHFLFFKVTRFFKW